MSGGYYFPDFWRLKYLEYEIVTMNVESLCIVGFKVEQFLEYCFVEIHLGTCSNLIRLLYSWSPMYLQVMGAYFEKLGSNSFAVYSIAVTDAENRTWFVKRRFCSQLNQMFLFKIKSDVSFMKIILFFP